MIGELYAQALVGEASPDIESADGTALPARRWLTAIPAMTRCSGAAPDRPWTSVLAPAS
jgi:hypothetical protein